MFSKSGLTFLAAGAATAVLLSGQAMAGIIYQDFVATSPTTSVDLNGLQPSTNNNTENAAYNADATWTANTTIETNGEAASLDDPDNSGEVAYLPFKPVSGQIYTLSATLDNATPGEGTGWVAIGFGESDTLASTTDVTYHTDVDGKPWMLLRANGATEAYEGPAASGGTVTSSVSVTDNQAVATLAIVLNTTGTDWTAAYYVNGILGDTVTYTGTNTSSPDPNPTGIKNISFGDSGESVIGTVQDFELSTPSIPEPATLGLVGVGAAGLLLLKRRRAIR